MAFKKLFGRGSVPLAPPMERQDAVRRASTASPPPHAQPDIAQPEKSFWAKRTPVIACGAGLFSDGYLNSAIGPVNTLLTDVYGTEYTGNSAAQNISAIAFVGQVVGIWFFGYTSDHWSRKWSLFISSTSRDPSVFSQPPNPTQPSFSSCLRLSVRAPMALAVARQVCSLR